VVVSTLRNAGWKLIPLCHTPTCRQADKSCRGTCKTMKVATITGSARDQARVLRDLGELVPVSSNELANKVKSSPECFDSQLSLVDDVASRSAECVRPRNT
jgi:hypothetical protein